MGIREQMQSDFNGILNIDEFGEEIEYQFAGDSEWHTFVAIVNRNTSATIGETSNVLADQPEVSISRSDVPVVTRGGDKIRFAPNWGGDVEEFTVKNIVSQTNFRFRIRVG